MSESKYSCSFLNAGQGSMQLVEEGDKTNIVIDCHLSNEGEYVRRYLGRRKVNHIDLLILSGTDDDHADAAGLQTLINFTNGDIRHVWYPKWIAETDSWKDVLKLLKELEKKGTRLSMPTAGEGYTVGGFLVKLLSPHPEDSDTSNDASLVVKITAQNVSFLFPGDCESEGRWKNIIRFFKKDLPSNVLLAPHHGSKNGCVEEAIKLVSPQFTVVSCGEDNQFGHPDPEAMQVYKKYSQDNVFVTCEEGSLLFESDGFKILNVVKDSGQHPDGKKGSSGEFSPRLATSQHAPNRFG